MQKKNDARYVSIYTSRNNEDAMDDNLVVEPRTRRWRSTRSTVANVMYSSSGYRRDETVMIMAPSSYSLSRTPAFTFGLQSTERRELLTLTRAIKPVFVPQLCILWLSSARETVISS